MKLAAGLVLAAVALVHVSASPPDMPTAVTPASDTTETQTLTIDRNGVKPMDSKQLEGLGPQRRPDDNLGRFGPSTPAVPDNTPALTPTVNDFPPCCKNGEAITPGAGGNSNYETLNPNDLEMMGPSRVEGLGPKTNYTGVQSLDGPAPIPEGYQVFYPDHETNGKPDLLVGPGPEVHCGMPGIKDDPASKAWREYIAGQPSPGEGGATLECPTSCVGQLHEVCGSNGVTYFNECVLTLEQCRFPGVSITKMSDGSCQDYSYGPWH